MRNLLLISMLFLVSSCGILLDGKSDRRLNRAERKLERLTTKFPELVQIDTLRDTVEVIVPKIDIDTFFTTNTDVSGVDSILNKFEGKIDSLTALKLGDEIKYYITKRQVIEDTLYFEEDGMMVKIWQEGEVIRTKMFKPEQIIEAPVEIPFDQIKPVEENWFEKSVSLTQRFGFMILMVFLIIIGVRKLWKLVFK